MEVSGELLLREAQSPSHHSHLRDAPQLFLAFRRARLVVGIGKGGGFDDLVTLLRERSRIRQRFFPNIFASPKGALGAFSSLGGAARKAA